MGHADQSTCLSESGVSVTSVLEEFHKVKSDFQGIVKQVEELKSEQQTFVDEITKDLKLTGVAIEELRAKVGLEPSEQQRGEAA